MEAFPNFITGGRSTTPLPEGAWPTGSDGRVELKYCVPEPVAASVLTTARVFLLPDPLAAGPAQRVTSLYLDTAQLTFLPQSRQWGGLYSRLPFLQWELASSPRTQLRGKALRA